VAVRSAANGIVAGSTFVKPLIEPSTGVVSKLVFGYVGCNALAAPTEDFPLGIPVCDKQDCTPWSVTAVDRCPNIVLLWGTYLTHCPPPPSRYADSARVYQDGANAQWAAARAFLNGHLAGANKAVEKLPLPFAVPRVEVGRAAAHLIEARTPARTKLSHSPRPSHGTIGGKLCCILRGNR
jgi:hypothetical protein